MLFEDAGGLAVSREEGEEGGRYAAAAAAGGGGVLNLGVPEFSFERNEMVKELIKGEERRRMS